MPGISFPGAARRFQKCKRSCVPVVPCLWCTHGVSSPPLFQRPALSGPRPRPLPYPAGRQAFRIRFGQNILRQTASTGRERIPPYRHHHTRRQPSVRPSPYTPRGIQNRPPSGTRAEKAALPLRPPARHLQPRKPEPALLSPFCPLSGPACGYPFYITMISSN